MKVVPLFYSKEESPFAYKIENILDDFSCDLIHNYYLFNSILRIENEDPKVSRINDAKTHGIYCDNLGVVILQNLTDKDFIKYTEYINEYYLKCNLIWNNISFEDRRNAAIRKNNLNKQREFISIINLNVANKNLEIQESNIDNLSRLGSSLKSLTKMFKQVDKELNIFIETFQRRREYIRERAAKSQISPLVAKNIAKSNFSAKITHLAKLKMQNPDFNLINEVIELGFTTDNAKIVNQKIDEYIKVQKEQGREQLKIIKNILIMRK